MRIYDCVFWIAIFFLCGVLFGSIFPHEVVFAVAIFVCVFCVCFFLKNKFIAYISCAFIVGFFYVLWYASFAFQINAPLSQKISAEGLITKVMIRENSQALTVKLREPMYGRIQIVTSRYPEFHYGDAISFEGNIEKPDGDFAGYYLAHRIAGVSVFPKIERIGEGGGVPVFRALFELQDRFLDGLRSVLSPDKASFAGGLIVGNRSSPVSYALREDLQKSGTSHLVALSGYNITIIIKSFMIALGLVSLTRRFRFPIAVAGIVFFVIMVGTQASIVRAALMGVIVLLASESERLYSARNAITLTAFGMSVWNPFVLAYDIGFQLSFTALLGIIYLKPALEHLLRVSRDKGFLSWKEHMMTTISAQLAVLPLLIFHFENFSIAGFFTNALILFAIPVTMLFGFITGVVAFFSPMLALVSGAALNLLLTYEISLIKFFASINALQYHGGAGIVFMLVYYLTIIGFIVWINAREEKSYETLTT